MTFKEANAEMLKGKKVTRPAFKGYWFINQETGKYTIHLPTGKDISYGQLDITIRNTLAEDWTVVEEPAPATDGEPTKVVMLDAEEQKAKK